MSKQELFDKFIEFMGEFAQIRAVAALRDGFIMTTPFTICGSVFLLLANLPLPSDLQGTHGFAGAFQFHKSGTASGEENDTVRHSVKAGRYELQRDTSHIFRRFYEFSLDSLFIHCLPPSVTGHDRHNFPPIFTTRVFALTVSASGFVKAVLNIRGNSCVVRVRYVLLTYRRCLPYRG